jgi:hypothetical protein
MEALLNSCENPKPQILFDRVRNQFDDQMFLLDSL